jgi:hypothetical protein
MLMKERLLEAFERKENDVNSFVWKGKKSKSGQSEVKMMDCSPEELRSFYKHCESMLNSTDRKNPGRNVVYNQIQNQKDRCTTELFLRWLNSERNISKYAFLNSIREFLENNPQIDQKEDKMSKVISGCPQEFMELPISLVLDGCLDCLGVFNKHHITLSFILEQGVWLSSEESKQMKKEGYTDSAKYIVDQINTKTSNKNISTVKVTSRGGIILKEVFSMIALKNKKYSEMDTFQIETLRNKMLSRLEKKVKNQAEQWKKRMIQIEKVLEAKGEKL